MDKFDLDLYALKDDLSGGVEELSETAAAASSFASLSTLGTLTGCASSFGTVSSFG